MKKFYKSVTLAETPNGWTIHLDGKPVKTPARSTLFFPEQRMAEAAKTEWDSQKDTILPDTMPVTQIMMTMIDRVTPNRAALQNEILNYIDTDLICYFVEEPEIYATAQKDAWGPVLVWLRDFLESPIETTTGLSPIAQPETTHKAVKNYAESLDDPSFTALYLITTATGSIFLGLSFLERAFSNDEIFHASLVEDLIKDTIYMADTYGISPDQERKRNHLRTELENCSLFLKLLDRDRLSG